MINLQSATTMWTYNDWANGRVLGAAAGLADEALDRAFDMGRGSLRRTLLHILAGEHVWLQRWQGRTETPWPDEEEKAPVADIARCMEATSGDRAAFLAALGDGDLAREVIYRDSKGSLFAASLGDMILQGITHSLHHRAQGVNMIRRAGGGIVELDYMTWIRKPA